MNGGKGKPHGGHGRYKDPVGTRNLACSKTRQKPGVAEEWWGQCRLMDQIHLPSSPWPVLKALVSRNLQAPR